MLPEIFNQDLVFEISKYLFHHDLRRLKLAFPEIKISKSTYLEKKDRFKRYIKRDHYLTYLVNTFRTEPEVCPVRIENNLYSVNLSEDLIKLNIGYFTIYTFDQLTCFTFYESFREHKLIFSNKERILKILFNHKYVPLDEYRIEYHQLYGLVKSDYLGFLVNYYLNIVGYNNCLKFPKIENLIKMEIEDFEILILYLPEDSKRKFLKVMEKISKFHSLLSN